MAAKSLPAADELRQFLTYDSETGHLTWKRRTHEMMPENTPQVLGMWNARYAGTKAGSPDKRGYIRIRIRDVGYPAHRAIWKIVHGTDPLGVIDHINGDPADNRLVNLRVVSQAENTRNSAIQKRSSSGVTGVSWNESRGRWFAHIKHDGHRRAIGLFETFNDAVTARKFAERILGFHPNHGRLPRT